jgi:hypothetical protein
MIFPSGLKKRGNWGRGDFSRKKRGSYGKENTVIYIHINVTSLVVWWSELLTTNHEVPGWIPCSAVVIFPCRGRYGLGNVKKAIPLQALTGSRGFQEVEAPRF